MNNPALILFLFLISFTSADEICGDASPTNCYFVSPSGSDSGTCGTESSPCKTLTPIFGSGGRIYSDYSSTPKTVVMREGSYYHPSGIFILASNVTLKNYPGENPRIWLETNDDSKAKRVTLGIGNSGSEWAGTWVENVTIDGIELEGAYSFALKIYGYTKNVIIRNCEIHGSGLDLVKVVGCAVKYHLHYDNYMCNQNALFEFNEFYDSGYGMIEGYDSEGIDADAVYGLTVRNNYFHDIFGTAVYCKGHCNQTLMEDNFVFNSHTGHSREEGTNGHPGDAGGGLRLGGYMQEWYIPEPPLKYEAENGIIRNNIIVKIGDEAHGLAIMGCNNCSVYNNTVYHEDRVEYISGSWINSYEGNFIIYRARSNTHIWSRELGRRNSELTFKNNILVDSLDQATKNLVLPIVTINGPYFPDQENSDHTKFRENIYYRATGE